MALKYGRMMVKTINSAAKTMALNMRAVTNVAVDADFALLMSELSSDLLNG